MKKDALEFFVSGEWAKGAGDPFPSLNPANGKLIGSVCAAAETDLEKAVDGAKTALNSSDWGDLNPHERARYLYRFGELIDSNSESLSQIQMMDNGKTISECRQMISDAANCFRYYAGVCETAESIVTPSRGNYLSINISEPIGIIGAITPWNSPALLEANKLAPMLAAGNCVLLKPSEYTPLIALEYAKIAEQIGLPAGVLSVLTGGSAIGQAIVEHPAVGMISFTGGPVAGKKISERAGALLKPVVLELGGKSPNIVFADADLSDALDGVIKGIFSGAGQSCVAGSRIFVQRSIYNSFVSNLITLANDLVLGHPDAPSTDIGPLINFGHRDLVHDHVSEAIAEGAELLCGGKIPTSDELASGAYYPPTLISNVHHQSKICQEEVFGPVGVILPFDDEDELVSKANSTDQGLASGIWTKDQKRTWRIARKMQAGTVWINTYKQQSISTPFGGYKQSGQGREKGIQGMKVYMQSKSIIWSN